MSAPINEEPVKQTYKGTCHCGKVQFEFLHPPIATSEVLSCNCSICTQRGYLFIYITDRDTDFKFTKGSWEDLTEYRFGPRKVEHYFCPVCGSGVIEKWEKEWSDGKEGMGINVRAVEGVDVDSLKLMKDDGRSN